MTKNMFFKHLIAMVIELLIPSLPVIYSYFYKKLIIFEYLSFFEMLSIVYLVFSSIALISTKGNTIGYKLVKLVLVSTNNGEINLVKSCARILMISGFLFLVNNIDYTVFFIFLIMIIPIPINYKNKTIYSLLNRLLGLMETDLKT